MGYSFDFSGYGSAQLSPDGRSARNEFGGHGNATTERIAQTLAESVPYAAERCSGRAADLVAQASIGKVHERNYRE